MGRYRDNIRNVVYEEDVHAMLAHTNLLSDHVLLSLLWLTAARPSELIWLRRKNIDYGFDRDGKGYLSIKLETKKLQGTHGFVPIERTLTFSRPLGKGANYFVECLIKWCQNLQPDDTVLLGSHTAAAKLRRMARDLERLSRPLGRTLTPYFFRHSMLTILAANETSIAQLMHIKGASNARSVEKYVHAVPSKIALEGMNFGRFLAPGRKESEPKTQQE